MSLPERSAITGEIDAMHKRTGIHPAVLMSYPIVASKFETEKGVFLVEF